MINDSSIGWLQVMNKRILLGLFVIVLAVLCSHSAWSNQSPKPGPSPSISSGVAKELSMKSPGAQSIQQMQFPALEWKILVVGQQLQRCVLSNGIVVYMQNDHTTPMIEVGVLVKGGKLYESFDNAGISGFSCSLQRRGGTRSLSPKELAEKLEIAGLELQSSSGSETVGLSMKMLQNKLDMGLELLADVACNPRFDAAEAEIIREKYHEALRRANDRPSNILGREFMFAMYGDDPNGRRPNWDVLKKLSVDDLRRWHALEWTPDRAFIAVAGNFEYADMVNKLESSFGGWKPNGLALPSIPVAPQATAAAPGVWIADKALTQSSVRLGHLGVSRSYTHSAALEVMNYILGGGTFSSRLVDQIRTKEGLAYSVYSDASALDLRRGTVSIGFQTKVASTRRAIDIALEQVQSMREKPVSPQEIEQAKNSLINSTVFEFATPMATVVSLLRLEIMGRPSNYYQERLNNLRSVTSEQVQLCAQEIWHPEALVFTVVGSKQDLQSQLESLGPIHTIEWPELKD